MLPMPYIYPHLLRSLESYLTPNIPTRAVCSSASALVERIDGRPNRLDVVHRTVHVTVQADGEGTLLEVIREAVGGSDDVCHTLCACGWTGLH